MNIGLKIDQGQSFFFIISYRYATVTLHIIISSMVSMKLLISANLRYLNFIFSSRGCSRPVDSFKLQAELSRSFLPAVLPGYLWLVTFSEVRSNLHVMNDYHFRCCHGDYNMNYYPGFSFSFFFFFFHSSFLCPLLLSYSFLFLSLFWDERLGLSLSPVFQSQSVADPSSERDYPSISVSHTLISHVSLWSFVSATLHPEWRDFSLWRIERF